MNYLDKFTNHLEFLGYEIENKKSEDGTMEYANATHNTLDSLMIFPDEANKIVYLRSLTSFDKKITSAMYEYLDEVNGQYSVLRSYIDEGNSTLCRETHFTGDYDKKVFNKFFELVRNDWQIFHMQKDFEEIWIK